MCNTLVYIVVALVQGMHYYQINGVETELSCSQMRRWIKVLENLLCVILMMWMNIKASYIDYEELLISSLKSFWRICTFMGSHECYKWKLRWFSFVFKYFYVYFSMIRKKGLKGKRRDRQANKWVEIEKPTVEYCSTVWDPYICWGTDRLENVNTKVTRFIMHSYSQTSGITTCVWNTK